MVKPARISIGVYPKAPGDLLAIAAFCVCGDESLRVTSGLSGVWQASVGFGGKADIECADGSHKNARYKVVCSVFSWQGHVC